MKLHLVRYEFSPLSTIGKLSVNGVYECYTLERFFDGMNLPNLSAIPEGEYELVKRHSPHLGYEVLGLCNVPGRSDIEIHVGNIPADIRGCILVGKVASNDRLWQSTMAFNQLMGKFQEPATITIGRAVRDLPDLAHHPA